MPHFPHDALLLGTILGVLVEATRPVLLLGPGDPKTGEALSRNIWFTWAPGLAVILLQSLALRDPLDTAGLGLSFLLAASACRLLGHALAHWFS